MLGLRLSAVLGVLLAAGACAVVPPSGPNVWVVPSEGKDLAQFQQEDGACRQSALEQIGFGAPQQAANQSAVGSAAAGTARSSAGSLQQRYDLAYMQCMTARGNTVPLTAAGTPHLLEPYTYYGPRSYYGPYLGGPAVTLGFFGGGWRHRHHHWGHRHHHHGGGWHHRGGWHHGGGGRRR